MRYLHINKSFVSEFWALLKKFILTHCQGYCVQKYFNEMFLRTMETEFEHTY
jgi:hypothetical protein